MTIPEYDKECDCEFCDEERKRRNASHSSAPVPEGYIITKEEIKAIAYDGISTRGLQAKKDALIAVRSRQYNEQSIRQDEREQWKKYIKSFHEEDPLLMAYSDGYKSGKKDATEKVLDELEKWRKKLKREHYGISHDWLRDKIEELRKQEQP